MPQPLGVATLAGYRFVITADGYASVAPAAGQNVHGLVWRLTPRDRVTLDAWENVAGGLYRAETLPVAQSGTAEPGAGLYRARVPDRAAAARLYGDRDRSGARCWNCPPTTYLLWSTGCRKMPQTRPAAAEVRRIWLSTYRHVIVRGRVQGVGYRAWTERAALSRGLTGWVRNRRDGSVEAVFIGDEDAVDAMVEACRSGPAGALVEAVDHRDANPGGGQAAPRDELFSVLPTADLLPA